MSLNQGVQEINNCINLTFFYFGTFVSLEIFIKLSNNLKIKVVLPRDFWSEFSRKRLQKKIVLNLN